MYAIATVFYGVPLNSNEAEIPKSSLLEEAIEEEQDGFTQLYSGGSNCVPSAFGVQLSEFDECCHHIDISTLQLSPTAEQVTEYKRLYEALEPELQKELEVYGEPRVFILWSTS